MSIAQEQDEDEETTGSGAEADAADDAGDDADDADAAADDAGAAPAATPTPAPAPDRNQLIKDYIAKQYGAAADGQGVKDAIARSQRMNTIANFGDALESLARARSQAHGGQGVDSSFYQGLKQQGAQGIQQAQAARQQQIQDFVEKRQIGDKAVQEQSFEDEHTPGNDTAKRVIASFNKTFPQYKISDDDAAHLSAADIKGYISGNVDIAAKIEANKEMAKSRAQQAQAIRDEHADRTTEHNNIGFAQRFAGDENKFAETQGKIDQTLKMVDQATKGGVASQLVPLEVAREIAGRLNPQEIAAAGGDPSTVDKIARLWDKAMHGKMTGDDAKEYRALLQSQKETHAAVREKQRETSIQTYAKASKQNPDYIRSLTKVEQPKGPQTAGQTPAPPAGGSGTATAAPMPQVGDQEDGYEFLGGDPGDQKNWKKIGGD